MQNLLKCGVCCMFSAKAILLFCCKMVWKLFDYCFLCKCFKVFWRGATTLLVVENPQTTFRWWFLSREKQQIWWFDGREGKQHEHPT